MRKYMRFITDPMQYLNAADYPDDLPLPELLPDFEWVDGDPPEGAEPYREVSLAEKLEAIFIGGGVIIPPELESQLFLLKAGIAEMLKFGRVDAARATIEGAVIPEDLEPLRAQLLEIIDGAAG